MHKTKLYAIGFYHDDGLFQIVTAIDSLDDVKDFFDTRMSSLALLDKKMVIIEYDASM
jgi:hypothetical protein